MSDNIIGEREMKAMRAYKAVRNHESGITDEEALERYISSRPESREEVIEEIALGIALELDGFRL